jgi:hypothetical protein
VTPGKDCCLSTPSAASRMSRPRASSVALLGREPSSGSRSTHPMGLQAAHEHFGLRRIGVRCAAKRGRSSFVFGAGHRRTPVVGLNVRHAAGGDSRFSKCVRDLVNARGRGVRDSPVRSSPLSGVADMHDGQRPVARRAGAHQITVARPIVYLKACPQRLADGTKDHDACHCVRPRPAVVRCATLSRYVKYARDRANG